MLPTGSISTAQPASRAQPTKMSRISASSLDRASRRRPVPRKRPISADRSIVAYSRSEFTSRVLVDVMRFAAEGDAVAVLPDQCWKYDGGTSGYGCAVARLLG